MNENENESRGYYSKTMADMYGSVWWRRPDGSEVEVTSVGARPHYEDTVDLGVVVEHSRGCMLSQDEALIRKLKKLSGRN